MSTQHRELSVLLVFVQASSGVDGAASLDGATKSGFSLLKDRAMSAVIKRAQFAIPPLSLMILSSKRNDNRGVLLAFLKDLFQLVFLLKINKTLDRKEAAQILFEAFELWLGTSPLLDYTKTPPPPPLKQPTGVCLTHAASGQRIDFRIEQAGERRVLKLSKVAASEPPEFPVVRLDEVVDAAFSLTMDDLMRLLYRNELIRNNPRHTTRQLLALVADREIRKLAMRFWWLYRGCYR